ncbi:hypothetical protein M3Y94_00527000 [Aphelenchoides besseyi]|nr:hypothetical protein M3Y94_00527000 [Aphelenchoides besseyi]
MSVPVRQKYELLSLPGWNRAEPIRMLFKLAGQEFTDCRLSIPEWRAFKLKASLPPEARLPLLRINSRLTVVGAGEIGRLLAREFGFYAETTIESHYLEQINQYLELLNRGLLPIVRDILSKNEKLRMQHWDEYKHELLRPHTRSSELPSGWSQILRFGSHYLGGCWCCRNSYAFRQPLRFRLSTRIPATRRASTTNRESAAVT